MQNAFPYFFHIIMKKNIHHDFLAAERLSPQRTQELLELCTRLSISFRDLRFLEMALRHRSFSNEGHHSPYNNERLEFLGDAVLGMTTAAYLYDSMLDKPEGDLAKIKSVVVSEMTLAPVALKLGIDKYLVLGHGEERSGGRHKKAILADALEAIIGAYYLDAGYVSAQKLVLSFIIPEIEKVHQNRHQKDYKTLLQELYQKQSKACPVYTVVKRSGPDHNMTFWISVSVGGCIYGPAAGKNKKEAEQAAAKIAYERLSAVLEHQPL